MVNSDHLTLVTWNVNGLRAQLRKQSFSSILATKPDFICLQETRCTFEDLPAFELIEAGYHYAISESPSAGYAGTCILSKKAFNPWGPDRLAKEYKGRLQVVECGPFTLVNVYAPHGHRDQRNLPEKHQFFEYLKVLIKTIAAAGPIIVAGDLNIAHHSIDLSRPKANIRNTMFTEAERKHLDDLMALGLYDAFREMNPELPGYTWWPWAGSARANNVGWRIDYVLLTKTATILPIAAQVLRHEDGSDHCPVRVTLKLKST